MNILKQEKGSVTLFVLVSMLFFVLFVSGMYMLGSTKEQSQIGQISKIKQTYEKGMEEIDEIYETMKEKYPYIVTYEINNTEEQNEEYVHDVTMSLANNTQEDINDWEIELQSEETQVLTCSEANYEVEQDEIKLSNTDDNGSVTSNNSVSFRMRVATTNDTYTPTVTSVTVNQNSTNSDIESATQNNGTQEEIPVQEKDIPIELKIEEVNNWPDGQDICQIYEITIKRVNENMMTGWKFNIQIASSAEIQSAWNADYTVNNGVVTFTNKDYNGTINLNEEIIVGFIIKNKERQTLNITNVQIEE